jgi:hypothetical protein
VAVRIEVPSIQDIPGVRVRVDLSDPRWALLEVASPPSVTVRFAGPYRELIRVSMDLPTITIPLDAVSSADTVVVLSSSWISVQGRPGLEIEGIQPSTVRIRLEPIERRGFPPALRFEGSLPDALALARAPVADPVEIRVSGPRSRLEAFDSVPIVPIDLSAITESGAIPARVDSAALAGLTAQPLDIRILFQLEEKITGSLNDVPLLLPGTLQGEGSFLPRFSAATVILQGARSAIDGVDPSLLWFVVDTSGVTLPGPGEEAEFPLRVQGLPAFVSGEARPETVTVRNVTEAAP